MRKNTAPAGAVPLARQKQAIARRPGVGRRPPAVASDLGDRLERFGNDLAAVDDDLLAGDVGGLNSNPSPQCETEIGRWKQRQFEFTIKPPHGAAP